MACVCSSAGSAEAERGSKAEAELADALYRVLPDAANARLGSVVLPVLGRRADIQGAIAAATAELQALPEVHKTPSVVT